MNTLNTIGLFGTCGKSTWRTAFIDTYKAKGVSYYNPQLAPGTWTPECAIEEALHLSKHKVLLFAITNETHGFGSLAEVGFSILNAIKNNTHVLVYIAPTVAVQEPVDFPTVSKESRNARALVLAHLKHVDPKYVTVCSSLEDLLTQSIEKATLYFN